MKLQNPTISKLKQKLYDIEEYRNKIEFELLLAKKKEFFLLTYPLKVLDKVTIKDGNEKAFFAGITFDDIDEVRIILYKTKSNGDRAERRHGKRFKFNEIVFNKM